VDNNQSARSAKDYLMGSSAPSLLIRADASSAIGSGHAMRCLALAKAWQSAGGIASWLMAESIPAIEERIAREGCRLSKINAEPGSATDAERTVEEARRVETAWIVVDGYRFFPDYIRQLRRGGLRALFLDDDGRFESYPADAVLNQNIAANPEMYGKKEPSTRLLLGSEYVLLRPEFIAEPQTRAHPTIGSKVLITMGGSDSENVTIRVLRALPFMKTNIEAKVVVGGGYQKIEALRDLVARLPLKIQLEENPGNMAPLMRWADVAVSGAGSTCWELAYLGLPSIVIIQSPDQRSIAQGLAAQEIAVNLGEHANLSTESISDVLDRLLTDLDRRRAMSERGRKLIDGRGAMRVVQALRDFM
jgi:UDP-2,4-diacetamido-2,4,6-trideoxy-beta-L-altropyranose hydrolase